MVWMYDSIKHITSKLCQKVGVGISRVAQSIILSREPGSHRTTHAILTIDPVRKGHVLVSSEIRARGCQADGAASRQGSNTGGIYTYTHTLYIYIYMHIYIYIYICISLSLSLYIYIYIYIYMCLFIKGATTRTGSCKRVVEASWRRRSGPWHGSPNPSKPWSWSTLPRHLSVQPASLCRHRYQASDRS